VQHLSGVPLFDKLVAKPTNNRLDWNGLPETDTLAYHKHPDVNFFITSAPGHNVRKLS
jgi:hypothetical protein